MIFYPVLSQNIHKPIIIKISDITRGACHRYTIYLTYLDTIQTQEDTNIITTYLH